jgi:hypothetical protein
LRTRRRVKPARWNQAWRVRVAGRVAAGNSFARSRRITGAPKEGCACFSSRARQWSAASRRGPGCEQRA